MAIYAYIWGELRAIKSKLYTKLCCVTLAEGILQKAPKNAPHKSYRLYTQSSSTRHDKPPFKLLIRIVPSMHAGLKAITSAIGYLTEVVSLLKTPHTVDTRKFELDIT